VRLVVDDVVLFTSRFAGQASVDIETVYDRDDLTVFADADQLKQVLVNLVSNAVQAMGETGGTIRLRASGDRQYVYISVADTGPGVEPEVVEKVFDPFSPRVMRAPDLVSRSCTGSSISTVAGSK